ncbi:MAG: glycoside hydrolase family 2 TIM barrel-domain containing protein [Acidobacteriaceae bacterium]
MKHRFFLLLLAISLPAIAANASTSYSAGSAPHGLRVTESFDANWQFVRGDFLDAEQPGFSDGDWQTVSVPQDWSIAGPFAENNSTGAGGAFLPAGIGWYRKSFVLPQSAAHKRVFIEFDGVMADSDVWINGTHLDHRPYGYVSLRYELTGHLSFGRASHNVIAVRCDDSAQPASRWAPGAGIYRHVRLIETSDLHVDGWGTFVSTPSVSSTLATVRVASTVQNQSLNARDTSLRISLFSPDGKLAARVTAPAKEISEGSSFTFMQDIVVPHPDRWDIDHPVLYRVVVDVVDDGRPVDEDVVAFGIREFHFDAATGFWLNGRNFKIKGACLHAEYGAFGAAVPVGAWRHRLEALRKLGVNAIRTAHNPPSPEFLDLCDRMGFLVMDELFDCWTVGKNPYDYHLYFKKWYKIDTRDTVLRDRNHPSIILWSAGNEIHDTPNAPLAHGILASLVEVFHQYDPTRPVTMALFRPNVSHDYDNGLADLLDVIGQNYRENEILAARAQKPTRKIIGTENGHSRNAWLALRDNPAYAGQFLWSGADYLGEAHVWPYIGEGSGLVDRTDFPHPRGLERQSWWSSAPMVRIVRRVAPTAAAPVDPGEATDPKRPSEVLFTDWTPQNRDPHVEDVEVYSNAEQVELRLNGRSLGSQAIHTDASPRSWQVAFVAGTLRAIATNGGKVVATDEVRTAGAPARVVLSADSKMIAPGWENVDYLTATVVDGHGVVVPNATNLVTFHVRGQGFIAAVDNGDNTSHESFQGDQRSAFHGRSIAFLKARASGGSIEVTASSPELIPGVVSLSITASAKKQ